jgi:hypothetical protein
MKTEVARVWGSYLQKIFISETFFKNSVNKKSSTFGPGEMAERSNAAVLKTVVP